MILNEVGILDLIKIITKNGNKFILIPGIWLMSNLCGGEDTPNYELIKDATLWLVKIVIEKRDPDILEAALMAISDLTESGVNKWNVIQCLIDSGCLIKLISLLKYVYFFVHNQSINFNLLKFCSI